MMHTRSRGESVLDEEVKISLTPMIDITFLILVFFLCTLQFKRLDLMLSSYLPTDQGIGKDRADFVERVRVSLRVLDEDRHLEPEQRRVILARPGAAPFGHFLPVAGATEERPLRTEPADTLQRLRTYLEEVRRVMPDAKAIIDAEPSVPHGCVVVVLDMFKAVKLHDVSFAGLPTAAMKALESGETR